MKENSEGGLATQPKGMAPLSVEVATQWAAPLQSLRVQENKKFKAEASVLISPKMVVHSHGGTFSVEQRRMSCLLSLSTVALEMLLASSNLPASLTAKASPCKEDEAKTKPEVPSTTFLVQSLRTAATAALGFPFLNATSQFTL